ncbi:MAG: Spy/CpxP family protein refolding chaperone [Burkholderiales bacterium]|jgi:hypothetical protein
MNRYFALPALLALSLLAAPPLAMADHHMDNEDMMDQDDLDHGNMNQPGMDDHHGGPGGQQQHYRNYDPVQRAEKHLGLLEKELKLNADQQSAWKTYSDSIMTMAQQKAARMEQFRANRGVMRNLDTASKLEKLAQWAQDRADRLEQLAKDTRTFQQALTAEQQTAFDQFWRKHARYGKGHRRHNS